VKTLINWKVYLILVAAAIVASYTGIPYSMEVRSIAFTAAELPALIAQSILLVTIQFAFLVFLGMLLMKRIGLAAPILDAVTKGEPAPANLRRVLLISVATGVVAGLVVLGMDALFRPLLIKDLGDKANALLPGAQPAAWKGFLASFTGAIVEELWMRLGAMSLLAWLGSFLRRTPDGKPTNAIFWIANILAAAYFGYGHLAGLAALVPLTALVVTRTLLGNAIAGIIFGRLYQTRGLESAMIAHFSADIVLHVFAAL